MDLGEVLQRLEQGDVVGLPTETVYGLAARIDRPEGLRKIFSVKERPFFDPLIVHVASIEQARALTAAWPRAAEALARRFWPGPLTLVLPKSKTVDGLITSGLDSVGLRCPKHPLALSLIASSGPLAAPSANRFGKTSPTTAAHVRSEFPDRDLLILDGGPCEVGIESTVLKIEDAPAAARLAILRPGAVVRSGIERVLSDERISFVFESSLDKRSAPGQLQHHYMPDIPLLWSEGPVSDEEALAALREARIPDEVEGVKLRKPDQASKIARLRLPADPRQAARALYAGLRSLAESGADVLLFEKESGHSGEAWESVLERLRKASLLRLNRNSTES